MMKRTNCSLLATAMVALLAAGFGLPESGDECGRTRALVRQRDGSRSDHDQQRLEYGRDPADSLEPVSYQPGAQSAHRQLFLPAAGDAHESGGQRLQRL